MNNFNRQIYSFVFVVDDGVVVVVRDVVCAVVDVLLTADGFCVVVVNIVVDAVVDPVVCFDCDEGVVMTVDAKQRISE